MRIEMPWKHQHVGLREVKERTNDEEEMWTLRLRNEMDKSKNIGCLRQKLSY